MTFWITTGALALGTALLLALAFWRSAGQVKPAAAFDLSVFRDQLAEVDRDAARGVIGEEDAERLRTDISRRILAADKAMQDAETGKQASRATRIGVTTLAGIGILAGSFGLYQLLGAPGYGDISLKDRIAKAAEARANRPSQADAEASLPAHTLDPNIPEDYLDLVSKLREAVKQRPDDLRGAELLTRHEMALGNALAAYKAHENVLRLKGDDATAEDYANYADMLVIAAGGYVSPEAEAALAATLKKDPKNGAARYYYGLMMQQIGRPDIAFRAWSTLLRDSGPDDGWVDPIRASIEELAFRAGVEYTLPPKKGVNAPFLKGPNADDMAAAQDMTEEERQDMIRGMVGRLSDRLATEGGAPEEWARLINALGVLGDTDQAKAIWANAQDVFAGNESALAVIGAAAEKTGVTQ